MTQHARSRVHRSSATSATSSATVCSRSSPTVCTPTRRPARTIAAPRRTTDAAAALDAGDRRPRCGSRSARVRRARRRVARRRPGDAAAARERRVRALARRVPARVRRHPRRPRGRRRRQIRSTGLDVDPADLRRACEVQARSHLLHLREGFLETRGQRRRARRCSIVRSAAPFAALLTSVARLQGLVDARPGRRGPARRTPAANCRPASSPRSSKLAQRHGHLRGRGDADLSRVSRRRRAARRSTSTAGGRRERSTSAVVSRSSQSLSAVGRRRRQSRARSLVRRSRCAGGRRLRRTVAAAGLQSPAADLPELTQPVNDFAHVIDAGERRGDRDG